MSAAAPTAEQRKFAIRSCLGRGGFGEVYRAVMTASTGLETEVAVKLLHEDAHHDDQAVERIRDEGRVLGALVHPSILRIYDFVVLDGRVGLITEYVEGQDLSNCIRGAHPMPVRAAVSVVGRVADALRAAWETVPPGSDAPLRLVHRDIKPANIRIGRDGSVKLLDFGVARSNTLQREAHTSTGTLIGSYLYMAPELLRGETPGPASDVYALGATLFESLAGRRLFKRMELRELYVLALQPETLDAFLEDAIAELKAPAPVVRLLRSMLAGDPDQRPSVAEISARCEDLNESLPGASLRRWCRSRAWPPPHKVTGLLDGRTVTESTLSTKAFGARPPAGTAAPSVGMWIGALGAVGGLGGLFVAVLALLGLLVVWLSLDPDPRSIAPARTVDVRAIEVGDTRSPVRREREVAPRPASSPPPTGARLRIESAVPARLIRFGRTYENGSRLPRGDYTVQADWGTGFSTVRTIRVDDVEGTVELRCNRIRRTCAI